MRWTQSRCALLLFAWIPACGGESSTDCDPGPCGGDVGKDTSLQDALGDGTSDGHDTSVGDGSDGSLDASDALDAASDAVDASEAGDASDAPDTPDVIDATDATDAPDAPADSGALDTSTGDTGSTDAISDGGKTDAGADTPDTISDTGKADSSVTDSGSSDATVDSAPDVPLADAASLSSDPGLVRCFSKTNCILVEGDVCCTPKTDSGTTSWKCWDSFTCVSGTGMACDESADCTGSDKCCASSVTATTSKCQPTCTGVQLCMTSAECGSGKSCVAFSHVSGAILGFCS